MLCVLCWAVNNSLWVLTMKISSLQSSNKEQKPIALGPRPLNFPENFSSLPFICLTAYKLDLVRLSWKPDSLIFRFLSHYPCPLEEPKATQLIVYSWNRWSTHLIILERQRYKCFWICGPALEEWKRNTGIQRNSVLKEAWIFMWCLKFLLLPTV